MAIGKLPDEDGGGDEGGEAIFAEINITPLTDVFLVMVIIFMVSALAVQVEARREKHRVKEEQQQAEVEKKSGLKVNLPSGAAQEIDIGFARVLCIRITYLGELGYELYIPAEQTVHVYDRIVAAGERVGLVHAGLKALASLRMEKGYRDYGHDIDNTDTVLEAGLGFAVDLKKPGGFLGKDAVVAQKALGPLRKRLVQVLVTDPEPMLFHAEVVRRNDRPVGYIRAASYGHTLGGAVGLAMIDAGEPIDAKYLEASWDVEIAGARHPVKASLKPLYDPENKKVKL